MINQAQLFFVLTQDFESDFPDTIPGRIMDYAEFQRFATEHGPVTAVAVFELGEAIDYSETYFPDYAPDTAPTKKESGIASRRRELGRRATVTRKVC